MYNHHIRTIRFVLCKEGESHEKIICFVSCVLFAVTAVSVSAQEIFREEITLRSCGEGCYEFVAPVLVATDEIIARGLPCFSVTGTGTGGQSLAGTICYGVEDGEYKVTFKPSAPAGWVHKSCINGSCSECTPFADTSEKAVTYIPGGTYYRSWKMAQYCHLF